MKNANKGKTKKLMEPFLQQLAVRDKAIVETTRTPKFKAITHFSSTSQKLSDPNVKAEEKNKNVKNPNQPKKAPIVEKSFHQFTNSVQIQTSVKHEVKSRICVPSTPTTMSLISEASIRSSVSSMMSAIKNMFKMEENQSFANRLVIPFSGFTEADVKEIRGGREPKSKAAPSRSKNYHSGTNDPRPVLKRYQSEKRKTSYDRYLQESLENFLQARSNTEDSSYNTVLAVKMVVDNTSKIEEKISNLIIDEAIENTSKDTICFRNSDILSARLDRILNPASFENLISQNIHEELETQTVKSNVISDCSHLRTKLKDMRKELEKIEKQYNKIQNECDEAEKAFFSAKLNFHRMKLKRDKILTEMDTLEKELSPGAKCNYPINQN